MRLVALVSSACLLAACAPNTANTPAATTPNPSSTVSPSPIQASPTPPPSAVTAPSHVFVIVMENRCTGRVTGNAFVAQRSAHFGVASHYHVVSHPSLPNYLAMTSGSTWGIADD